MRGIRLTADSSRPHRLSWITWQVAEPHSIELVGLEADGLQNDLTPVTGQGWKSAVRIRMLHATVRVRIAAKKGMKNVYDHKVDGIPINQEYVGSFTASARC